MHQYNMLIALELADERAREAAEAQRRARMLAGRPERPSILRRGLARTLAAVSRGSALAVRALDDCVADDLGRSLAPTK